VKKAYKRYWKGAQEIRPSMASLLRIWLDLDTIERVDSAVSASRSQRKT